MSYTALYRKFRPNVFEDVKGQEHIVRTLKNQVKSGRVGHAYIFCGTRGTGKTTLAKILARAVNCENPVDGSPCNECAMCRSIARQTSMNVIEIDAASNRGVDSAREIVNEVKYSPTEGKYKVYIIDEAHMLTTEAHNALLKTLEEPPEYMIFILATTEEHSIPVTILSRCQRYDFHRIDINTISNRLLELTKIEGLKAEERALRYVAKAADGSMRDALSLLDQCIACNYEEELTYDEVLKVLGAVNLDIFHKLLCGILDKDVTFLLKLTEDVIMSGKELGRLVTEFTWYLRNLLVLKASDDAEEMVEASKEDMEMLKKDSGRITFLELLRDIRIFSELSNQLRYAVQKRALLEVSLVRLCIPQMDTDIESLHIRIKELERALSQGVPVAVRDKDNGDSEYAKASGEAAKEQGEGSGTLPEYEEAVSEEVKSLCSDWQGTIRYKLEPALRAYTDYAVLEPAPSGGNHLQLRSAVPFISLILNENLESIKTVLEDYAKKKIEIRIVSDKAGNVSEKDSIQAVLNKIQSKVNFPVEIE